MSRLKKIPQRLKQINKKLIKSYSSVNLYFQDESRFGMMTHVGTCLTARGVKPIVNYKHNFGNTYLYGSFSPINGDSFVWEIEDVNCEIFEAYLHDFSLHNPNELKVVIIDNAGFHSTKNIDIPENVELINLPPYTPELNPSEKIWSYIKEKFKNKIFDNLSALKGWLCGFVKDKLSPENIKSITNNQFYLNEFINAFN